MFKKIPFFSAVFLFLLSCKVGPDYKKAEIDAPESWQSVKKSENDKISKGQAIKKWWKVFDDPILESLIEESTKQNLTLKIAKAKIAEARANSDYAKSDLYPKINANGTASRNTQFFSQFGVGFQYTRFAGSLDATWELDLFGSKRRALEEAKAYFEAIESDHNALVLSVLSEVARNYIDFRNYQNQLQTAIDNLSAQKKITELSETQAKIGKISNVELMNAKSQLEIDQAAVTLLESMAKTSEYNIELLLGKKPESLSFILSEIKPVPVYEEKLILDSPVATMAERPDIKAAERRLAAATAYQGVARAEQYPKISLSALVGSEATAPHDLTNPTNRSWAIAGGFTAPIFNFGRIKANIKAADARQNQAFLQYQQIVLDALKDVENNLLSYVKEESRRQNFNNAAENSQKALNITKARYELGRNSVLDLMNAKKSYYTYQTKLIQSKANTANQLITLYKALGGFE